MYSPVIDLFNLMTSSNDLIGALDSIHQEGRSMDEFAGFPVPRDLFDHIDKNTNTCPESYLYSVNKQNMEAFQSTSDRLAFLDASFSTFYVSLENVQILLTSFFYFKPRPSVL